MVFCTNYSKFYIKPLKDSKYHNELIDKLNKLLNLIKSRQLIFTDKDIQNLINIKMFDKLTFPTIDNFYYQNFISDEDKEIITEQSNCDFCHKEHGICRKKTKDYFNCKCKSGYTCTEGCEYDNLTQTQYHYDVNKNKTLHVCKKIITCKIFLYTNDKKLLDLNLVYGRENTLYNNMCEDLEDTLLVNCDPENYNKDYIESGFGRSLDKNKIFEKDDEQYKLRDIDYLYFGDNFSQALRIIELSLRCQLENNIDKHIIEKKEDCMNIGFRFEELPSGFRFKLIYLIPIIIVIVIVAYILTKNKKL